MKEKIKYGIGGASLMVAIVTVGFAFNQELTENEWTEILEKKGWSLYEDKQSTVSSYIDYKITEKHLTTKKLAIEKDLEEAKRLGDKIARINYDLYLYENSELEARCTYQAKPKENPTIIENSKVINGTAEIMLSHDYDGEEPEIEDIKTEEDFYSLTEDEQNEMIIKAKIAKEAIEKAYPSSGKVKVNGAQLEQTVKMLGVES